MVLVLQKFQPHKLISQPDLLSDNSELPWPRMNKSEVQNYATIFMDIDTNRDGSITRDEAHKNFSNGG